MKNYSINYEINSQIIRIKDSGELISLSDALRKAVDTNTDLIELSVYIDNNKNQVSVCIFQDYQKFLYQQKKREKVLKAGQAKVIVKELRFGPQTDEHDYQFKLKHAREFINSKAKVKAYIMFKGREIEIRAGIYTGNTPIKPFFNDYSFANADTHYQDLNAYTSNPKTLYLSPKMENQEVVKYNGKDMTAGGENGPFYDQGEAALTGFYGRKWLNPDPSFAAGEGKSAQPFILMRYAEVLLNAAEAAIELSMAGVTSPDGEDLLQLATKAVNDIRERAGATLLTSKLTATDGGRDIVRKERRKELAFEHKTKWDLRRWRVQHYENREGFWGETRDKGKFSNNSQYRFRGLYPFFSTQAGKYFFDARFQWASNRTASYSTIDYYFGIPGDQVTKSPVIDQQPNR